MNRGLRNLDPALRQAWHPLCRSTEVTRSPKRLRCSTRITSPIEPRRRIAGVRGPLPHRFAPLSLGQCEGENLRCVYHGWVYDAQGNCVEIPALGQNTTDSRSGKTCWTRSRAGVTRHGLRGALEPAIQCRASCQLSTRHSCAATYPSSRRERVLVCSPTIFWIWHTFHSSTANLWCRRGTRGAKYTVTRNGLQFEASYEHEFSNREDRASPRGFAPCYSADDSRTVTRSLSP